MTGTDRSTLEELETWLREAWDPSMTLRQWWSRLADSGWSQPHWPAEWFGRGVTRAEANEATRIIREFGAVTGPVGFATGMAGPTVLVHGTEEQRARHLRGMVD